jgi:serine/threonine-protein kinase
MPGDRFCPGCGARLDLVKPVSADPFIGRTLKGLYTILEHVGSGGMGKVYRAEQVNIARTIAVKVIHAHLIADEKAVARFATEMRACSRLFHQNSVSIWDYGVTEEGQPFMVMEFLRGKDLSQLLWKLGAISYERGLGIIRQVLAALTEAHELGIIHRDIKPENILVEPTRGGDFVKVVDYGLAKIRSDLKSGVTSPNTVCGTPDYMAPEQARGLPPDPRCDLYAVAAMLFHCVAGVVPYPSENPTEVLHRHVHDAVPDPRRHVPSLPTPIAALIMRGMAKDPNARFEHAEAFLAAIDEALAATRLSARGGLGTVPEGPRCARCGTVATQKAKHCAECGERLGPAPEAPPTSPGAGVVVPPAPNKGTWKGRLSFSGRITELGQLELHRARAAHGTLVALRVVGEEGAGKHRLVEAALGVARKAGDVALMVGPDPCLAGVAYAPIAAAVRGLLGLSPAVDPAAWIEANLPTDGSGPSVRAGFGELFNPEGARDLDARARTEGVVRALGFAVRGAQRARGAVTLALEQLHRFDAATLRVLQALLSRPQTLPLFLLLTHTPRFNAAWTRGEVLPLRGLSRDHARSMLAALRQGDLESLELPLEVLPLQLDQLVRWTLEGGGTPPPRLVDLISARLERLPAPARRAAQALCVLGECAPEVLASVTASPVDGALLAMLEDRGWLSLREAGTRKVLVAPHALVREVVAASLPAEDRREVYRACWAAFPEGAPLALECRALFGQAAEEAERTLLALERLGDLSLARGDDAAAAMYFRRGLELARRERSHTPSRSSDPDRAMVLFTRKLAESLVLAGDVAEAEGILREGLVDAPWDGIERARMEASLARVLFARGRAAEGQRALESALQGAQRLDSKPLESELLMLRAEVASQARGWLRAVESLERAEALAREVQRRQPGPPSQALRRQRAELLLRLARVRRLAGREADAILTEARQTADDLGAGLLRAQCEAEIAERAEERQDSRGASAAWRRAIVAARDAGDASLESQYDERWRRLNRTDGGRVGFP